MGIGAGKPQNGRGIYNNVTIIYAHIVGWGIFITYELTTLYFMGAHFSSPIDTVTHYLLNASAFYFNCLVVFPKLYRSKSLMQIPLLLGIMFEVILYLCIGYSLNFLLERLHVNIASPVEALRSFLFGSGYRAIFFYITKHRLLVSQLFVKIANRNWWSYSTTTDC